MKSDIPEPDAENADQILEWAGYETESVEWDYAREYLVEAVLLEQHSEEEGLDEIQEAYVKAAIELEKAYNEYDGDERRMELKALSLFDSLGEIACVYYFEEEMYEMLESAMPVMPEPKKNISN